jgi:hypothetical protein
MIRSSLCLVVVGLLAAVVVMGCGKPSCTELCEEAEGRGCNTFVLGTGSCAGDCALAERLADKSGCGAQKDARIDCEAMQEDICEVGCSAEDSALTSCVTPFCVANPSDPDCVALLGGT